MDMRNGVNARKQNMCVFGYVCVFELMSHLFMSQTSPSLALSC